jgi:uncharacterized membrane protein
VRDGREPQARESRLDRITKRVAHTVGTPRFLLVQGIAIVLWVSINTRRTPLPVFDPHPFQLLQVVLACQGVVCLLFVLLNRRRINRQRASLAEPPGRQ